MNEHVGHRRRRVPRKLTLGQRISRLITAPHLSHSRRLQRKAIIAVIVLLGVYLVVWPIFSDMFGGGNRQAASPTVSGAPNSTSPPAHALGKKK